MRTDWQPLHFKFVHIYSAVTVLCFQHGLFFLFFTADLWATWFYFHISLLLQHITMEQEVV